MILHVQGDATQPQGNGNKILVHVCNDAGKWGKGFVLAVSRRWKAPEQQFKLWAAGKLSLPFQLGEVLFVQVEESLWVANLIGQHGIKTHANRNSPPPVRYDAIKQGLQKVALFAQEHQASIHMPRIGAGLAGGDWTHIETIIQRSLLSMGLHVTVYALDAST
ncbi:macro domain-containing protein [Deinococcus misasensis]|uniref:macro domain-containing protein n=1 Tax=Deinococcus misasensis TaxID=392413 RepID=UPI0005551211|nr:macro domain-containing protein [Deinococcus misasensis]